MSWVTCFRIPQDKQKDRFVGYRNKFGMTLLDECKIFLLLFYEAIDPVRCDIIDSLNLRL